MCNDTNEHTVVKDYDGNNHTLNIMLEISIKLLFCFLELKLEELSKNSINLLQIALST